MNCGLAHHFTWFSHTVFKGDIQATTDDLVCRTTLRFPGAFIVPIATETSPQQFSIELKMYFSGTQLILASIYGAKSILIHSHLKDGSRVFLWHGGMKKKLQNPYNDPFKVYGKDQKTFIIGCNVRKCAISLDRIKPASRASDNSTTDCLLPKAPPKQSIIIRSGRTVRFSKD